MRLTATVGVLLLGLLAGCTGEQPRGSERPPEDPVRLIATSDPDTFVEVELPGKRNQAWVHGSFTVCLEKPGQVTVTSVEFESGDLMITDWLVRPNPAADGKEFAGDLPGTLSGLKVKNATTNLTEVCDRTGVSSYEVVLELWSGETSSAGRNVLVGYTSGGQNYKLLLLDRVIMCVKPEVPSCF